MPDTAFEAALRDALGHLYDPAYEPPAALLEGLGWPPETSGRQVRNQLIEQIALLQPASTVPLNARSRRLYDVLHLRYVEKLSQEATAERMAITTRHLRREQAQAVSTFAQTLAKVRPQAANAPGTPKQHTSWQEQVADDVAAFQRSAAGRRAELARIVQSVLQVGSIYARNAGVALNCEGIDSQLVVRAHPSALKQILLSTLTNLVRGMDEGAITISSRVAQQVAQIEIVAQPVSDVPELPGYLVAQLLSQEEMTAELTVDGERIILELSAKMYAHRVLVVDDNTDLLHFYQRFTMGTPFEVLPFASGHQVMEAIETLTPDIIVLDVMLPGIDGWELLSEIRALPEGHDIPIIICSVMREEELALSLGATLFIAKPVRRRDFVGALEQAINAPTRATTIP